MSNDTSRARRADAIGVMATERVLLALAAENPPSPCVSVCSIDAASGLCAGCLRTLDEIAAWSTLDASARRAVWRAIADRAGMALPSPQRGLDAAMPAARFPAKPARS